MFLILQATDSSSLAAAIVLGLIVLAETIGLGFIGVRGWRQGRHDAAMARARTYLTERFGPSAPPKNVVTPFEA